MALDANEVFVAGSGHLYAGAVGLAAPTDATTTPTTGFVELGYMTEDGASLQPSMTVNPVKGWQSFYTLRNIVADRSFGLVFAMMQWNYETLKLAMGGGTTTGTSPAYHFVPADPSTLDERAMIADFIDGSRIHRWYFPRGIISDVGEIQLNRAAAAGLRLTYTPQLQASSNAFEVFFSDAQFSAT